MTGDTAVMLMHALFIPCSQMAIMGFFVYILECRDKSLYTGIARDIEKRIKQHSLSRGSRYVRSRLPVRIVYSEGFRTHSEALKREIQIKRMTHAQKAMLALGASS
jgi:putative endonuclease